MRFKTRSALNLKYAVVVVLLQLASGSRGPPGMVYRSCLYGYAITSIQSLYSEQGRSWEIQCSRVGTRMDGIMCKWGYKYANRLNANLKFTCPAENSFLTGMYSEYNAGVRDRRWRMECCNSPGFELSNCRWYFRTRSRVRADLNVTLPSGTVIKKVIGKRIRGDKDRRWNFRVCAMTRKHVRTPHGDHTGK